MRKAQQPLQFFRSNNKTGINFFETGKNDSVAFTKLKVRIGGNFTQDFQALHHKNDATPIFINAANINQLASIKDGFTRAMANLNIDVQLEDGIRMNLTLYLSSRHHEETWVKGGYIQFDKLPFLKNEFIDKLMKSLTIKIGDYEVDYGDQHFRRSDGGNTIYNPFVENYIMDEFATEIGSEIYYHNKSGFMAMAGITNGQLNPTVIKSSTIDTATGKLNKYTAAFHGKIGFDKQLDKNVRVRLTGSFYIDKSAAGNTLFFGDRTGSHYFFVMENKAASATDNAWSGRFNPQFSQQVRTFMINPFIKYKGVELFGTYEMAKGRTITEPKLRKVSQFAVDLIYRFPAGSERFWIATRFNAVHAALPLNPKDVEINRAAGSAGWFITKNIMLKVEYVNQLYRKFAATDIRSNGQFNGLMAEAIVAF